MKKPFKVKYNSYSSGFTLMEVMIALGILAVSLTAIFNVQASSMAIANRVKHLTAGTLLARSKMIDIENKLMEDGFSDFGEEMEGDFEEEGWPLFRWKATIKKVELSIPTDMPSSGSDSQSQGNNAYAGMMSGYSSMITDMISNSLRECNLTVEWDDGRDTQQIELSTHFIEFGRAQMLEMPIGQSGGIDGLIKNSKSSTK